MLNKQLISIALLSLSLFLAACDSSQAPEKTTNSKNTELKKEQADVLPYLNIQQQAADIAQPFCETKNCIALELQSLKTADPWLNQWIAQSQAHVVQNQIGLKQALTLQQAVDAYVKKSDRWQAEFKGNKAYSLTMYTRIPYQRNQFVLLQVGVDTQQENISVKERYYFFVADRKNQKAVALLEIINPQQQSTLNTWVQQAYQDWLKQQETEVRQQAPQKLYWGQADWFFDQEGIGLHYRTHEIVKGGKQLDIYFSKVQTQQILKPNIYTELF